MKKTIILSTIAMNRMAGGIERNITLISNYLSDKNYSINLITFDKSDATSFYDINKNINWYKLGISQPHYKYSLYNKIKLLLKMRNLLKKPQFKNSILICFHHGLLLRFFVSTFALKIKIVCSERNSLKIYDHIKTRKWNCNFLLLFFVNKIIVQFKEYINDYPLYLKKKIIVINNALNKIANNEIDKKTISDNIHTILSIGRLSNQKQHLKLIKIFEKIAHNYPDWNLNIVGDGEYFDLISSYLNNSIYKKRIFLFKPKKNVSSFYNSSDLFCTTSLWEGFPNSLAEALSHGLPAIGFSNCEGVNILIEDNINGFLVKDENEYINKLELIIKDKKFRIQLSANAKKITDNYNLNKILHKWEEMILNI